MAGYHGFNSEVLHWLSTNPSSILEDRKPRLGFVRKLQLDNLTEIFFLSVFILGGFKIVWLTGYLRRGRARMYHCRKHPRLMI
jgi:hypothetical protein